MHLEVFRMTEKQMDEKLLDAYPKFGHDKTGCLSYLAGFVLCALHVMCSYCLSSLLVGITVLA